MTKKYLDNNQIVTIFSMQLNQNTMTEIIIKDGEEFTALEQRKSNGELLGWNICKNGNWLNFFLFNKPVKCFGEEIPITDAKRAINLAILVEQMADVAEKQFYKLHPELNP